MKRLSKQDKIVTVILIVLMVLIFATGYAWLSLTFQEEKTRVLHIAGLEVTLDEATKEGIHIAKASPTTDEEGKQGLGYTFTIQNGSFFNSDYQIFLDDLKLDAKDIRLDDEYIKYQLVKNNEEIGLALLNTTGKNPNRLLDEGIIKMGEEDTYTLRLWTDIDAPDLTAEHVFKGQIRIEASPVADYKDKSGAAAPVLASNMIPVVYNEEHTRWEKANLKEEWYNYDKQMWANAVTVTDDTRSIYQGALSGTEVKMDDILQMFVWIPRYSYTIKSEDGSYYYGKQEDGREDTPTQALPGEIDIKFISTDTKEEGSAKYTGTTEASGWFTPAGFTFGEKELPGIWVGKFETGYLGATSISTAEKDTVEPNKVIVKPNVYSWRNIRISTLDLVSRKVVSNGNIYGFDDTYDSHAAKNIEWETILYLVQSKYGKYGNSMYKGVNKKIYIHNNSHDKTGCSSGSPSAKESNTCNQYNMITDRGSGKGALGAGASTTGNIYGIYDMNGSAWEYIMASYSNENSTFRLILTPQ